MNSVSKILIGTANFFSNYGLNNNKINDDERDNIINFAQNRFISGFDTALAYGENFYFYKNGFLKYDVINKLIFDKNANSNINKLIECGYKKILFHNFSELSDLDISLIAKLVKMYELKHPDVKFGSSIYKPFDVLKSIDAGLKIIQCPVSIVDHSFMNFIENHNCIEIEIHARSIFLQGLLLKEPANQLPMNIRKHSSISKIVSHKASKYSLTNLEYCILAVMSNHLINRIVIGISSLNQLKMIIKCLEDLYERDLFNSLIDFNIDLQDPVIINPKLWA